MALFTPEELAELAAADAELEEEFVQTPEEIRQSRERDKEAALEGLDHRAAARKRKQRAYREANRPKIAEYRRAYREANRDQIAEYQRAYYEANRDQINERQRAYREANRDQIAEYQRAYYEANMELWAEVGAVVRNYRKMAGLTQMAFAQALGVSRPHISHLERGRLAPDLEKIRAVYPDLAQMLEEKSN